MYTITRCESEDSGAEEHENPKSGSHLHVQWTDISRDMGRLRAECVGVNSTFKRACLNSVETS